MVKRQAVRSFCDLNIYESPAAFLTLDSRRSPYEDGVMQSDMPAIETITDEQIAAWALQIIQASDHCPGRRYLLGIAGIPGSGKSTLASQLLQEISLYRPGHARLVSMDGFHRSDQQLEAMGLLARKGSPESFDAQSYIELLQKAQLPDSSLNIPVYDRRVHAVVRREGEAYTITPSVRIVLTEGNYLLLRDKPWRQLEHLLDACWFLHTDPDVARRWLIGRHVQHGRSEQEAKRRYEHNDGPNSYQILSSSREPAKVIRWPQIVEPDAS